MFNASSIRHLWQTFSVQRRQLRVFSEMAYSESKTKTDRAVSRWSSTLFSCGVFPFNNSIPGMIEESVGRGNTLSSSSHDAHASLCIHSSLPVQSNFRHYHIKWVPFSIERKTIPRVINCILQWLEWSEISFYVIKNVLERFFVAFPEALLPHKLVQMTGQHGSVNTIHRFKLPFTILTHTFYVVGGTWRRKLA